MTSVRLDWCWVLTTTNVRPRSKLNCFLSVVQSVEDSLWATLKFWEKMICYSLIIELMSSPLASSSTGPCCSLSRNLENTERELKYSYIYHFEK